MNHLFLKLIVLMNTTRYYPTIFDTLKIMFLILIIYVVLNILFSFWRIKKAVEMPVDEYLELHPDLCPFINSCKTYNNKECHSEKLHKQCKTYKVMKDNK